MADMTLIGSRLTKVSAQRNPDFDGKLEIKTNIKFSSIERAKETKDAMKISYVFDVDYQDLGKIELEGIIFLNVKPKLIKELEKVWKNKEYTSKEIVAITNLVLQKASIKAFELEEELGLPIHIRLPKVNIPENK